MESQVNNLGLMCQASSLACYPQAMLLGCAAHLHRRPTSLLTQHAVPQQSAKLFPARKKLQTIPREESKYWTTRTNPSVVCIKVMGFEWRPRFSLMSHWWAIWSSLTIESSDRYKRTNKSEKSHSFPPSFNWYVPWYRRVTVGGLSPRTFDNKAWEICNLSAARMTAFPNTLAELGIGLIWCADVMI